MKIPDGHILSRDIIIASVRGGVISESNAALLPLYLKRTGDVESWLRGRAIDSHRTNSRLLKKALRLSAADDVETALKVHAATITDNYWFRKNNSPFAYSDVRFKFNNFDKLALRGDPDSFNQPYSPTPELTNIGSFEKCWTLSDGRWLMIKSGSGMERFSEIFICGLGRALGFPMAEYYEENGYVVSPDFTEGAAYNYEAAEGIVGDDEDYAANFNAFYEISPELAEQYMQIIYMDTLCFNMDRQTKNYGVLRDAETGAIKKMAPNYDNNIALFARGVPQNIARTGDRLIALFAELLERDGRALEIARRFPVPSRELIDSCAQKIPIPIDGKTAGDLRDFIMNGSRLIQERISGAAPELPKKSICK